MAMAARASLASCQGRLRVSAVAVGEALTSQRGRLKSLPKSLKLKVASPSWPPPSAKAPPRHAADTAKLDKAMIASLVRMCLSFDCVRYGGCCPTRSHRDE